MVGGSLLSSTPGSLFVSAWALVAAGHSGANERSLWDGLARHANESHERWQETRQLLLEHMVTRPRSSPSESVCKAT